MAVSVIVTAGDLPVNITTSTGQEKVISPGEVVTYETTPGQHPVIVREIGTAAPEKKEPEEKKAETSKAKMSEEEVERATDKNRDESGGKK